MRKLDLKGKRFGRLTVLNEELPYISPAGKPTRRWRVRCDCGKELTMLQNTLTRKNGAQSCGCARYEKTRDDLTGRRFGRLTVISQTPKIATCICDCGKEVEVKRVDLIKGLKSCGCLLSDTARDKIKRGVNGSVGGTNINLIRPGRSPNSNNALGILGVYYNKREGKYIAKIGVQGKAITLGRFSTPEAAKAARENAEIEYFAPLLEKLNNKL